MDNNINDIKDDLESNLDITDIHKANELNANKKDINWLNDIFEELWDLDISTSKSSQIKKNTTKNFDSVITSKRLKDIDISHRVPIYKKIYFSLKWRYSISWKPLSVFKKRVIFTKRFFKNFWYVLIFLACLLVIDKFVVESKINSWYDKILSIKDNSWDINYIKKSINNARLDFITWDILFKPFLLIPNENIEKWYYILQWWKNLTKLLDKWIQIYVATKDFIETTWWIKDIRITNLLSNLRTDFSDITLLLSDVIISYESVWIISDKDLETKFSYAKSKLISAYKFLDILNKDYDNFLNILGHKDERKYLVLFQNNDEIRPTWWFIWSLATITFKKWQIVDFEESDVYAYEWEINKVYTDKKPAPEWLDRITNTFWLRDSNYFVNFESSSKSINFFLDKINKEVDWIIYINQNTIKDFLKLTWWIEFEKLWETINEDNFSLIISTLVEAKVFQVWTLWTPKQILFDFANKFYSVLEQEKDYYAYLDIIMKNINTRDLVIYSFNPEENNLLWKLWLNWEINFSETLDFAYPVYTSIWGNKSDRYIELKYKKTVEQNPDCSIDTKLSIFRTHFFSKFEEQKVNDLLDKYWVTDKKDIINIQWKWVNKSYIRVLLPKDVIVQKQDWLKVTKFDNFTLLEYYQDTRVLESTHYDIDYKIKNLECRDYDFKLYKQPWIREYNLELNEWDKLIKELGIRGDYSY